MAFSVSEFSSQINKHGLAVNNLFVLTITPPMAFNENMGGRELTFFCRATKIPDNSLSMMGAKQLGYGPTISYPTGMELDSLTSEFMIDSNMDVMKFFHRWQQKIFNYNSEQGPLGSNNNQMVYEMSYKSDYAATIQVDIYTGHSPDVKYTYKFFDAWPFSVANPQLSWDNQAEIMTSSIQFKYERMTNEGLARNVVASGSGVNRTGYTSAYNTIGQLLNNTGLPRVVRDINTLRGAVDQFSSALNNIF